MSNLIKDWGHKKKDKSLKIDLESLEKTKAKLEKLRKLKELHSKKQTNHFAGFTFYILSNAINLTKSLVITFKKILFDNSLLNSLFGW